MKKDGKYKGRQLWRCKNCWKQSSEKRKEKSGQLWKNYVHGKQTYTQIAENIGRSSRWVQQQLFDKDVHEEAIQPGDVVIVMDTTYFRRTFGVMVWRCPHRRKNLLWRFVPYETVEAYIRGVEELEGMNSRIG